MQTRFSSEVIARSPRLHRRGGTHSVACRRSPCEHGSYALSQDPSNGVTQPGTPCVRPLPTGPGATRPSCTVPCPLLSAAPRPSFGIRRRHRWRPQPRA